MFRGDDASKVLAPEYSPKENENQESLEEYKARDKKKDLSKQEAIREYLIELNMKALNNNENFIDLVVDYIIASVAQ